LNLENKGYSYGNNKGIEFARSHYLYDYIVISNPDIEIQHLDYSSLLKYEGCIIGPKIINSLKKNQNPVYYTRQGFVEKIQLYSIKRENYYITYLAAMLNKFNKAYNSVILVKKSTSIDVYALHGSFLIISEKAVDLLGYKPFDDNMFLFAEEDYLAYVAKKKYIRMVYDKKNIVKHKEDGSMRLSNVDLKKTALKSLEYVFSLKLNIL
jgi:GT2 family glycosyltransferase